MLSIDNITSSWSGQEISIKNTLWWCCHCTLREFHSSSFNIMGNWKNDGGQVSTTMSNIGQHIFLSSSAAYPAHALLRAAVRSCKQGPTEKMQTNASHMSHINVDKYVSYAFVCLSMFVCSKAAKVLNTCCQNQPSMHLLHNVCVHP